MIQAEVEERPIPAGETRDRISTEKSPSRQGQGRQAREGKEEYLSTREGTSPGVKGSISPGFPSGAGPGGRIVKEDVLRLLPEEGNG